MKAKKTSTNSPTRSISATKNKEKSVDDQKKAKVRDKAPSSKHQKPNKFQIQNSNVLNKGAASVVSLFGSLEFGACLVLGACDLEFQSYLVTRHAFRLTIARLIFMKKIHHGRRARRGRGQGA
jgi:hypothetical protein